MKTMKLTAILLFAITCATFAATEENIKTNYVATSGGTLVVDVGFGAIEVTTNATTEVSIEAWRKITRKNKQKEKQFLLENSIGFVQDRGTVTVKARQGKELSNRIIRGDHNQAKYLIRVPAQFNVRLISSGGAIHVTGINGKVSAETSGGDLQFAHNTGSLRGATSGGDIKVSECDGTIDVITSGGDITLLAGMGSFNGVTSGGDIAARTFSGPVFIQTSGGDIRIDNVNGKLTGITSGGSIEAEIRSAIENEVHLDTSGGDVRVTVPDTAAFNLDAQTSAGAVSCDLRVAGDSMPKRGLLKGSVNGGGPKVHLRTRGGKIRVKKL